MSTITLERLTKLYPGGRGVRDLDLSVEHGEALGFIGPNGAGKSTAIRTMLGLIAPTAGRARIFGLDARAAGPAVRARIGYVPSEPRLYDGMTVAAMLAYLGRFFATDTSTRRRALAEVLDLDLSRRAEDLSIGNKKKVALVAALQHTPDVLILDEPTSGLDPLIQARFFEVIRGERARGTTVFFSSHVLSEVERLCDRVAILRDGKIVELARMADLRARQVKRVRVRLDPTDAAAELLGLAGIRDPVRNGERLSFVYQGDVKRLIAALAGIAVIDATIEEPSLEEIVLSHYGKAGDDG